MTIRYSKRFRKQFQKLQKREQDAFWERLDIFIENPVAPLLNNHALQGSLKQFRSINIGGDMRALYIEEAGQIFIFELIGTHSQLYKK